MKAQVLALVVATLLTAMNRGAVAGDIFPYPMTIRALDNGLSVVMVPFDSPGTVAYYSIVRVGSRNEVEAGLSGFAHFFEHMMFRGTDKYSTDAYNDLFKVLGSDANAYTSDDVTVYHALFGSSGLEQVIDAESDRFRNLAYSEPDFQQEAGAVLGEYNKNNSNPIRRLYEKTRETAFTTHTYKHTTMGFLDDIIDMPNQYEFSLKFFERFYTPSNTIILIVGDFDVDGAYALVDKYYGSWERAPHTSSIPTEPEQTETHTAHVEWETETLPYLAIAYKIPAFGTATKESAAIDILAKLLFEESSDLYRTLVIEEQLVESIDVYAPDRRDPGLFFIYTKIKDDANIDRVRGEIHAAVEQARTSPVDAQLLEAVKSNIRYSLAMSLDTAGSVASYLTNYIFLTGDPTTINDAYRRYEEVTAEDLLSAAREYFIPERSTDVTLTGVKPQ